MRAINVSSATLLTLCLSCLPALATIGLNSDPLAEATTERTSGAVEDLQGYFGERHAPYILVTIHGPAKTMTVRCRCDTGFDGELGLPPDAIDELGLSWQETRSLETANGSADFNVFSGATIEWLGGEKAVEVVELKMTQPLLGNSLLDDGRYVQDRPTGTITISASRIPSQVLHPSPPASPLGGISDESAGYDRALVGDQTVCVVPRNPPLGEVCVLVECCSKSESTYCNRMHWCAEDGPRDDVRWLGPSE